MGPHATLAFQSALLANTAASRTSDHVHLLVDCNPKHSDVSASLLGTAPSIAPELCATARTLEAAGATLLVMVCNAAHAYATDIEQAVSIPMLNMIEVAAQRAAKVLHASGTVGIMATGGCIASGIYQRALIARGLRPITLDEPEATVLVQTLGALGREPFPASAHETLSGLARRLVAAGADLLIAGCTEIPLVLRPGDITVAVLDPVQILAIRCIEAAGARVAEITSGD